MRVDKFLWCIRLCRTRSLATEAVKRERVRLNDRTVKPSVEVKVGDTLHFRVPPIWRAWRIASIPSSRVGPKLVSDFIVETTPFTELEKLELARMLKTQQRAPGAGRPSKRERRDIDQFTTD